MNKRKKQNGKPKTDKHLKRVALKIQKIMEEEDMGGFCVVHNKAGQSIFSQNLSPSYSLMEIEEQPGQGIQWRISDTHIIGQEKKKKMLNYTGNLMKHLFLNAQLMMQNYLNAIKAIEETYGINIVNWANDDQNPRLPKK